MLERDDRVDRENRTEDTTEDGGDGLAEGRSDGRSADVLPFPSLGARRTAAVEESEPRLRTIVGDVLREERHRQDRTLAQVAETAAVSLPYLSEVERGVKDVSSDLLAAICGALGLELADVLERSARRLRSTGRAHSGITMLAA